MRKPAYRVGLAVAAATVLALSACNGDTPEAPEIEPDPADENGTEDDADGGDDPAADADEEELAAAEDVISSYPREETVFTSGQQWGPPSSWNPIPQSGEATGLRGLLYEAPFFFNPHTLELEPWLAESGEWVEDDVYELTLREGLTWSDGEPLTADDVVFTYELGENPEVPWSNTWTWMDSAEAVDETTVRFTFSEPRYQSWDNNLYSVSIVPEHIMSEWAEGDYMSNQNENPVGSGAFLYNTHGQDRMVWERNDDWWGIEALGMDFEMRYIVDIVNPSNEVALGLLLQGQLDLSNNFLPGVNTLVEQGQLTTFYDEAPYMLSANTAVLIPNTEREPLDDAEFRRALATAIDVDAIVSGAYGGLVQPSHFSGMLPAYEEFYDDSIDGFSFDAGEAESILADAGYEDTNGDGYVETPDGEAIELSLIVPAGWTDWMEAARVIAEGAQDVGINVTADFPDSGAVDDARFSGDFDLLINNDAQLTNTPHTYWEYLYRQPIQDQMYSGNFGRWDSQEGWDLAERLAATETDDPEFQEILSDLQELHQEELHAIPLWYNGMWAQYNTQVWTNWPTSESDTPDHFASTWGGYWQMGGLATLADLTHAD
ncbi:ABC transporter substrate-binding protein [Bogoriella caseilytica]|uniref:Peptide/nickel transport system substrate-binding protein n=1 Tax=Bogoriella caseilytica TaxID=56055 RepID=A0A3N2BFQ1_9MICO|nr:ABC transporter substrate-binding protein [Bogoriella caseilytica]ROR74089.1 peptide/nickel transport system substrate-binding protein [Bogoriella caseilytica]